MSNGPNKSEEMQLITMDPEEFNQVLKRLHEFLLKRAEKAKEKKSLKPSHRAEVSHIEAAKDVFVLVHMIELVEHMSGEISELRAILSAMGADEVDSPVPEMFSSKKTGYLN